MVLAWHCGFLISGDGLVWTNMPMLQLSGVAGAWCESLSHWCEFHASLVRISARS